MLQKLFKGGNYLFKGGNYMRKYGSANFTYGERCWSVFGNICKNCGILTEVGNICDIKIAHLWPGIYRVHLKCKTMKTITCYNFPISTVVKTINDFVIHHREKKIVVFHSRWEITGIDALYTQLWLSIVSYIAWARANDSNATTS